MRWYVAREAEFEALPDTRYGEARFVELGEAAWAADKLDGITLAFPEDVEATDSGLDTYYRCQHCGQEGGH